MCCLFLGGTFKLCEIEKTTSFLFDLLARTSLGRSHKFEFINGPQSNFFQKKKKKSLEEKWQIFIFLDLIFM